MSEHVSVLLDEAIKLLNINPIGTYVDCTLGGGGHSLAILNKLTKGKLICFEQDVEAINVSNPKLLSTNKEFKIIKDNFVNIKKSLLNNNISKVDGILYDIGVSTFQIDSNERGFSYQSNSKLDMRMDLDNKLTAYEIINTYPVSKLSEIFFKYGEEKFSSYIANKIVKRRESKLIETTFELVDVIKSALPSVVLRKEKHPARKVFQSLRIYVNDELSVLEKSLADALTLLNSKGRIVVITFHSLEDRIVKHLFRSVTTINIPRDVVIKDKDIKRDYVLVNKKIITPSEMEIDDNNRSRSAKMRVIEKV